MVVAPCPTHRLSLRGTAATAVKHTREGTKTAFAGGFCFVMVFFTVLMVPETKGVRAPQTSSFHMLRSRISGQCSAASSVHMLHSLGSAQYSTASSVLQQPSSMSRPLSPRRPQCCTAS